jgi:hypothetical protein
MAAEIMAATSPAFGGPPTGTSTTADEGGAPPAVGGACGGSIAARSGRAVAGKGGRRRSGGGGGGWVSVKPFARSEGVNAGFALYSPSHPAQVGGEDPLRSQNSKNSIRGANLQGLLDGWVALYPTYRRLFYGFGPFKGSVRHALMSCTDA